MIEEFELYLKPNNFQWLTKNDIKHPGPFEKIRYYIHGCFFNKAHKYKYLDLRSKLDILQKKSCSMQNTLFEQIKLSRNDDTINFTNTEKLFQSEIKSIFKDIEAIIQEYKNFIYFTNSPYKKFIFNYFDKRDKICRLSNYSEDDYYIKNLKQGELLNSDMCVNHYISTKKLDETSKVISQFELMSEFIKSSVDSNDQLMFKFFLIVVNCLILALDFFYINDCNV